MWLIRCVVIYIHNLTASHNKPRRRGAIMPTLQIRNVRPRDVTWLVLVAEGPVAEPGFEPRALPLECVLLICLIETPSGEASPGAVRRAGGELVGGTAFGTPWL